jgi:hypothetical protein
MQLPTGGTWGATATACLLAGIWRDWLGRRWSSDRTRRLAKIGESLFGHLTRPLCALRLVGQPLIEEALLRFGLTI